MMNHTRFILEAVSTASRIHTSRKPSDIIVLACALFSQSRAEAYHAK